MTAPTRLDRTLLCVSGPDAASFLNNLLTQDVGKLAAAGVLAAALLSPQGKLIADMLLWAEGESVLMESDPTRGPDLLRRLNLYKLRAAVTVADVSAERTSLWSAAPFDGARTDPRLPALGWRAIAAPTQAADGGAAYDAHRLALGVPDLARDAGAEEVFALEALLEELNAVDFQKGCFVGQENVSRMKRRATTRKKFCPVVFEGETPAYGTPVLAEEAEIGSVRGGAYGRAIALMRLDRAAEAMAQGVPLTAAGRALTLDPPSWLIMPDAA